MKKIIIYLLVLLFPLSIYAKDNRLYFVEEDNSIKKVIVPNLIGLDVNEAKNILKEINLSLDDSSINDESSIITEQIPIEGVELYENCKIIVK